MNLRMHEAQGFFDLGIRQYINASPSPGFTNSPEIGIATTRDLVNEI